MSSERKNSCIHPTGGSSAESDPTAAVEASAMRGTAEDAVRSAEAEFDPACQPTTRRGHNKYKMPATSKRRKNVDWSSSLFIEALLREGTPGRRRFAM